jgi:hypothetical protein
MNFIVCSYGGSGSWMLVEYLRNFGTAYHIHDRYPPKKLTYPDEKSEQFSKREVEPDKLDTFKVIFIYRNPVPAIFSRFNSIYHLYNIQSKEMTYRSIFSRNDDCFGLTEFYNNYMNKSDRNYPIYCIKYETFFENVEKFNSIIGITLTDPKQLPIRKETRKYNKPDETKHLGNVYEKLIKDMCNRPPILII